MTSYGFVFDDFFFSPFLVTVGFVSEKASVFPRIFYDLVMIEVVKGDIFEFIGSRRTQELDGVV